MRRLSKHRLDQRNHQGILVLNYHSYHKGFPLCFEEHIKYLKKHYHILSPDGFYKWYALKEISNKKAVLITLDDGFFTDFTIAYPILKKHHVCAFAFVITDPYYTDVSGVDWWKEVEEVIEIGSHTVSHGEIFISNSLGGVITPFHGKIRKMYCMIKGIQYIPGFPLFERGPELVNRQMIIPGEWIKDIQEAVKADDFFGQKDWFKKLEWIIKNSAYSYQYESNEIKEERVKREILDSKIQIERVTGKECRAFAYPWGAYDQEVLKKVKEIGYQFAFTTNEGFVFQESSPFELNRVNVPLESSGYSIETILNKKALAFPL